MLGSRFHGFAVINPIERSFAPALGEEFRTLFVLYFYFSLPDTSALLPKCWLANLDRLSTRVVYSGAQRYSDDT